MIYTCDHVDKYLTGYQGFWDLAGVQNKIKLKIGDAKLVLNNLLDNELDNYASKFDLIYIDADKENYHTYYKLAYKLLKPGAIMVLDNMLRGGKVADRNITRKSIEYTRQMNKIIKDDDSVEAVLLPVGDGINLVRKK